MKLTLLGCSTLAITFGATAEAATPPANPVVGEVVVTGQRRESTVQNTAAAINVLSAERLEAGGTTNTMQLQFATAGLNVSQDISLQTQIFIRGIGSNLQGIATGNSVSTYVDNIYIPNSIQSAQNFLGIERVEVLKGPQATLYGRNATGGALLLVTKEPRFTFGGDVDASYGNYNAYRVRGEVDIPLVADQLALNLSAQTQSHDGYVTNLWNDHKLNYSRTKGVRGALKWQPTDDLTLILRADYTDSVDSDVYKLNPATSYYYLTPPNTLTGIISGQGVPMFYTPDQRAVYYNTDPRNPTTDRGQSITVRLKTPVGTITSVTSERSFKAGPIFADNDNEPLYPVVFGFSIDTAGTTQSSRSFYHDTFLTTDLGGRLNFIVGGNYFLDHGTAQTGGLASAATVGGGPSLSAAQARTEAWSVYLDGNFDLTSQLRLVAGVRYSSETKKYQYHVELPAASRTPLVFNEATFDSTNPRVGLEWRPYEGMLAYFTATSGFKSGGFNQVDPTNVFNPEKVWSYEGGFKTRFFDNRLRVATSLFYYDYKDIQVLQYLPFTGPSGATTLIQRITNGGTATIYGWDLDSDWQATADLIMGVGLELLHTEFGDALFCNPATSACNQPALRENVKGNPLARAPDISANIYAQYTFPLDIPGKLSARIDAAYRGKTFFTVFKDDFYSSDPYWLLNGNIHYDSDQNWFAEAYIENIADELAITNLINSSPLFSQAATTPAAARVPLAGTKAQFDRYAAPRTYGVRVGYKF